MAHAGLWYRATQKKTNYSGMASSTGASLFVIKLSTRLDNTLASSVESYLIDFEIRTLADFNLLFSKSNFPIFR